QSNPDCSNLDPDISTPIINMCEPGGKVVLEAHTTLGDEIFWYDSADTLSKPIEKGPYLDLGNVSSDTSYWVTEAIMDNLPPVPNQGRETYSDSTSAAIIAMPATTDLGLIFDAFEPFIIKDVEIYSTEDGGNV